MRKILWICSIVALTGCASAQKATDNVALLYSKDYVVFRWQGDTLDSSHFRAFFEFMGEDSAYANLLCFYSIQYLYQHGAGVDSLDYIMRTSFFWGLDEYACFVRLQEVRIKVIKNETPPDFRLDPFLLPSVLQRPGRSRYLLRRQTNRRRLDRHGASILAPLV
jgi:hypothetical protein